MIGNDVIDLNDPESLPNRQHRRFDRMAFTPDERQLLRDMGNTQTDRWSLWAAKEAAYKLFKQLDGGVRFVPRRFGVRKHREGEFEVCHEGHSAWVRVKVSTDFVHALALQEEPLKRGKLPQVVVVRLDTVPKRPPSSRIRKLVCRMAAEWFDCRVADLRVVTESKIPRLVNAKGAHCGYLSLSHHGRYMAFTLLEGKLGTASA